MAPPAHRVLTSEALALSSGTIATLTGMHTYAGVGRAQSAFVLWCLGQADQGQPWQRAWEGFWPTYCTPGGQQHASILSGVR